MVAGLLELGQGFQDGTPALHALGGFQPGLRLTQHGLVERCLLPGQVAVLLGLALVGQVVDDGPVGLESAQDEGPGGFLEASRRCSVPVALDGLEVVALELGLGTQEAGVQELHDGPEVADMVLHRRAGEGYPVIGPESLGGPGLLGRRVLDVLGLIQDGRPPGYGAEQVPVPVHGTVAGDDQMLAVSLATEGSSAMAVRAVVQQHGQVRREPGSLPLPGVDHGCWADQQVGPAVALLAVLLQGGQGLDGLAQAHVVGQAGSQPPFPEESQPRVAQLLVGPELAGEVLGGVHPLNPALLLQAFQELSEPVAGRQGDVVVLGPLVGAQPDLHDFPQADLLAVAPEISGGPDFVGVDLHPLAPEPYQRHLQLGQFLQFLHRYGVVTQGHLDIEVDQGGHGHAGAALHRLGPGPGVDAGPGPGALPGPPGGQQHAEPSLLQRGGLAFQEPVGLLGVQPVPGGLLALQAVGDGRAHRAGLGQGTQQELGGVEVRVGSIDPIFPHGLGGEQEALVVVGLEQVAQVPVVLPGDGLLVAWAGFRGLLQPEAEPVWRVGGDGQGPLPFGDLAAELLELCRVAQDRRVGLAQGGQPSVVGGVELWLRRVFGIRAGPCQVVDLGCYELPEDGLGRGGRRFGRLCAGERPGRRRHQSGQLGQPVRVLSDEHRNPRRQGLVAPLGQAGQELLPDRQGGCQLQGVGPVGQVCSDGDARFQDAPLVARLQQRDGLIRHQPECCYGPWPGARLGSGPGHGTGNRAGRHGRVAPAGQPGDCAGKAVVASFETGRFGQEPGLGAVGVFSSRLAGGRRRVWPGVLAPED